MRLVIVERDGVINHDPERCIGSADEWRPIDGSLEAIARLNRAGCRIVVAARRPGLEDESIDIEKLNVVHRHMHQQLASVGGSIEAVVFCRCALGRDCGCYRPHPGMLHAIAERLRVALERVLVVTADPANAEAALEAGAAPVLVRSGPRMIGVEPPEGVTVHDDLGAFADAYID